MTDEEQDSRSVPETFLLNTFLRIIFTIPFGATSVTEITLEHQAL